MENVLYVLPFLGVAVGFIGGFFGIGGGIVVVPTLIALGYDTKIAVGVSVMQMLLGAIFGSVMNYRAGLLRLNEGVYLGIGGLIGASFSGLIVSLAPAIALECILLANFLFSIYKLYRAPQNIAASKNNSKFLLVLLGAFVGAIATSIGIGGAAFIMPALVGFMGYEMKKAISMGVFFVAFASFSGFISLSLSGHVRYLEGALIGVFALIGVYFGTKTTHKTEKAALKKWFLLLYVSMISLMIKKIFFE